LSVSPILSINEADHQIRYKLEKSRENAFHHLLKTQNSIIVIIVEWEQRQRLKIYIFWARFSESSMLKIRTFYLGMGFTPIQSLNSLALCSMILKFNKRIKCRTVSASSGLCFAGSLSGEFSDIFTNTTKHRDRY
jgi:hypothetical protein